MFEDKFQKAMLELEKGRVMCYRMKIPLIPTDCIGCHDNKCKEWNYKEEILRKHGVTDDQMFQWIKQHKK